MIRIGICLDTYGNHGGVHQYSMALLNALLSFPKDKYEIVGICITKEWEIYCKKKGIMCYYTDKIICKDGALNFLISNIKQKIQKIDLLDCIRNNISIVFFPSITPTSIYINNSVCAIHDLMHRYAKNFPEITSPYQFILRDVLFRRIVHHSLMVLTDSNLGKKQVEDCYLRGKENNSIKVLPFIAPNYIYHIDQREGKSEWEKIRDNLPKKYFFYPAQFWRHKNHINLVKALDKLKEKYPEIHIVFVGSKKNEYENVINYIHTSYLEKYVTVLGYVSDYSMVQLYKHAQALLMASYLGPTNIPQLEAFYLGCPVAVADVFAVAEQVKNAAILFEPDNIGNIADCMEQLWCDEGLRKKLICKGYEWSRNWGPKQFANRLFEIYEGKND